MPKETGYEEQLLGFTGIQSQSHTSVSTPPLPRSVAFGYLLTLSGLQPGGRMTVTLFLPGCCEASTEQLWLAAVKSVHFGGWELLQ